MKAAVNTRYGPPDVVEIRQAPNPEPIADAYHYVETKQKTGIVVINVTSDG